MSLRILVRVEYVYIGDAVDTTAYNVYHSLDESILSKKGNETLYSDSAYKDTLIFLEKEFKDGLFSMDMTTKRRRFALKVKFGYLKQDGIEKLWQAFFPKVAFPEAARNLRMLAPGDFNAAYGTLRFYGEEELTAERILDALKSEIAYKDSREGRVMGL